MVIRRSTAIIIYRMVKSSQVLRISPSAIPAAGGCSVSVATIRNIAIPTDIAPNIAMVVDWDIGRLIMKFVEAIKWRMIPVRIPTMYPPRSGLVFDEYALGRVNAINAVAPSDAIIAVSVRTSRKRRMMNIAMVASPHWRRYRKIFCLNFLSKILTVGSPGYFFLMGYLICFDV